MIKKNNKICIIGAGPGGLAFAKVFKNRGFQYDQFEATEEVGGNWKHGVYDTAHIISSKSVTEYKSFPMPADYPDFPSKNQMCAYFQAYAKHNDLYKNIYFNTKVIYCRPIENNHWEVSLHTGEKKIYDTVILCNGHHWAKRFPTFEGTFKGEYIHSKDFKNPDQFRGKKVLTIGGGNSACDVASEAARVAECSHLSMRSGIWFLPKTLMGKPLSDIENPLMPIWLQRFFLKIATRFAYGDYHKDYNLPKPKDKIFERHPTLNSEILHYIKHGRIKVKPNIKKFDGQMVEFVDGSHEFYDVVVAATGFYVTFPFLANGIIESKNDQLVETYGMSMHLNWRGIYTPTVFQIRGGVGTLYEPEAEYLANMVAIQNHFNFPMANLLKEMGYKSFNSNVLGYSEVNKLMQSILKNKHQIESVMKKKEISEPNWQNVMIPPLEETEVSYYENLTIN
jgi:hypothetical protein